MTGTKIIPYLIGAIAIIVILALITRFVRQERVRQYGGAESGMCETKKQDGRPAGESAADACKKISSRAEEIAEEYPDPAKMITAALAFLHPKNYASGNNDSETIARNIVQNNLCTSDITKIHNSCVNTSSVMQSNKIDNTQCEWCKTNACPISNVTQNNSQTLQQMCTIQAAITTLMQNKSSIDAQALAKALQKAQGLLSGDNTAKDYSCNIVGVDVTANHYLEVISECANQHSVVQENFLAGCAGVTNVIQRNDLNGIQDCVIGAVATSTMENTSDVSVKAEALSDQETKGLELGASLMSCLLCILLVVGAIMAFMGGGGNAGNRYYGYPQ